MEYLERCGLIETYNRGKIGVILHSTSCRFRAPVFHPDVVTIGTRARDIQSDRFTMEYLAASEQQGRSVAEGTALIVCYDYQRNQKAALPPDVRERIEAMEHQV